MDGCDAETRGVGGVKLWEKGSYIFSSPIYFATSMPSCGCSACGGYSKYSMFRGVGVLWRKKDGHEAEIKGCGRCLVVE